MSDDCLIRVVVEWNHISASIIFTIEGLEMKIVHPMRTKGIFFLVKVLDIKVRQILPFFE